jgi:hypothetical protein
MAGFGEVFGSSQKCSVRALLEARSKDFPPLKGQPAIFFFFKYGSSETGYVDGI